MGARPPVTKRLGATNCGGSVSSQRSLMVFNNPNPCIKNAALTRPRSWYSYMISFFGFQPPQPHDAVFKVKGDLAKIRVMDYVARNVLLGAVQSTFLDGVRHHWAEFLSWLTERFARFLSWLARWRLGAIVWLLKWPFIGLASLSKRAERADYVKRTFVTDEQGDYTLMLPTSMEHRTRSVLEQLKLTVVSEKYPGTWRLPKVPKTEGSEATFTFTTPIGEHYVIDFWG
ncbi:MAG: hypothetical protein K2Z81_04430 [Cyanobacteria bacterium]|nr:hypothetical protein [Cyanobacteriota bacterium]